MSNDVNLPIPDFLDRNPNKQVATTNGPNDGTALIVGADASGTSLLILDAARQELAGAKSADEVISIRNKAIGLVAYARQASDRHLEAEAVAIQMEAERRLGEVMQQQRETVGLNKGGRPKTGIRENPVSDQRPTLAEADIDKNLAHKARAAAAKSAEEFQAEKDAKREAVLSRTGSRRKVRRAKRGERKRRPHLENRLSEITAVCRYEDGMEIPSEFNVGAAIATVTEAIDELNKLIRRLEEARAQK